MLSRLVFIAAFFFSCLPARAALAINAFSFPNDRAAEKAWTAHGGSPSVSISAGAAKWLSTYSTRT